MKRKNEDFGGFLLLVVEELKWVFMVLNIVYGFF